MNPELFPFRNLEWRRWFHRYTTPRDWKKGARDVPFGLGAKTLYVDGTNGNDANDGESWKTAKKTIQAAVDVAESWSHIFVKAGTYSENVSVSKNFISLLGETRDSVIIQPSSDDVFTVSGNDCRISSFSPFAPSDGDYCIKVTGDRVLLDNLKLDGATNSSGIWLSSSDHSSIRHIFASNANLIEALKVVGTSSFIEISHNVFDLSKHGVAYLLYLEKIFKSKIFENDLGSVQTGLYVESDCSDVLIFHNNFISNSYQIEDRGGTRISYYENYFDDHSNSDNGFGIATEPYSFHGGSDPRPVVCRDGWLVLSWADADQVALASVCTEARLAELDAANIPADIDTLLSRLTATRAGYLDELDFDLDARLGSPASSSIAADIADLITRTKGLNDIHDDLATVDSVVDAILANQKKYWHWNAISGDYRVIEGTWALATDYYQHLTCVLYNSSDHMDDEIAIPFYVPSTDARTLNIRCKTKSDAGIVTVKVESQSQGTIDLYSSSTQNNVIKTISITPARAGMNVLKLEVTDQNPSSSDYYCYISELWLT